jgi:hypothetical protein
MLRGTSWSTHPTRWQFNYPIRFTIDPYRLPNERFEINGDKVYYQTMAMKLQPGAERDKAQRQADEYGRSGQNLAPETFVVGTIENLLSIVTGVLIVNEDMDFDKEEQVLEILLRRNIPVSGANKVLLNRITRSN